MYSTMNMMFLLEFSHHNTLGSFHDKQMKMNNPGQHGTLINKSQFRRPFLGSAVTITDTKYVVYSQLSKKNMNFLSSSLGFLHHYWDSFDCSSIQELLDALHLRNPEFAKKRESCICLNLIFQFLFRELRDTQRIRRSVPLIVCVYIDLIASDAKR